MESTDIRLICRLCAKEDKFCIDIFGQDGIKNNISKKIRLCLPIAVKEDDEFPKQICLSCLNKLDTSYELYSGCMNAQNTIKKLLKIFARPKPPESDVCVIKEVQNDTNLMVQQLPALSLSKPFMKFGKTIVQLQDASTKKENDKRTPESVMKVTQLQSERHDDLNLEPHNDDSNSIGSPWQSTKPQDTKSKKRGNEYVPEPRVKVRRLQSEICDNLTLELGSDDSNSVGSTMWSLPLDDDDDDDDNNNNGGGGSTQATQQVSQSGQPTGSTGASSDELYIDGTIGTVSSSQQQFGISGIVSKASSGGQLVDSIPTSRGTQFLGTVQTVSSVGTKIVSSSSASGLVMTSSELGHTPSQYVKYLPSMDSALPVMAQQPRQNTMRQPNVYIPDSVCRSVTGKQGGSTTASLNVTKSISPLQQNMFQEKLQQSKQLCLQKDALQQQSSQQEQAKQHQQYTLLKNQEPTLFAFADSTIMKLRENKKKSGFVPILPADNTGGEVSSNVLITTPSCVVFPQQKEMVSVKTSSPLKRMISATTRPLLQLPIVEARQMAAVQPTMQTGSQHIYISSPIQDNTSIVSDQQTEDFENQHPYSSGHHVQAKGSSSDATDTTITNSATSIITGVTVATVPTIAGGVSLGASPSLSMVTPTAASLLGSGVCAPSPVNMGAPTVTGIGIMTPISNCTLDILTATDPASTFSTVTSVTTSVNSTAAPGSDSAVSTEIPSKFDTISEQISDSMLTDEESSYMTEVKTLNTMSSITTHSTVTPTSTVVTIKTDNSIAENTNNICEYCNKIFPDDIIVHHRKLHFRQRFFSCIVCGKNFRTEVGLENHRCGSSAE